jgi:hypothetical protein
MRNSEDLYGVPCVAVDDQKGKARNSNFASTLRTGRPPFRGIRNSVQCLRYFPYEPLRGTPATQPIPTRGFHAFFYRRRMKGDLPRDHSMAEDSLRLAFSSGTGFTFPESKSCMRRITSRSQAASTAESSVSSKLSINEPASSARSATGKVRAFLRISMASSLMVELYLE